MRRDETEKIEITLDDNLDDNVCDLLNKTTNNLSKIGLKFQEEHYKFANSLSEISKLIEEGNVVAFNWCGNTECGKTIEDETGYNILGIKEEISEGKCIASNKDAKYLALIAKTY